MKNWIDHTGKWNQGVPPTDYWQATDGNWYPPSSHPKAAIRQPSSGIDVIELAQRRRFLIPLALLFGLFFGGLVGSGMSNANQSTSIQTAPDPIIPLAPIVSNQDAEGSADQGLRHITFNIALVNPDLWAETPEGCAPVNSEEVSFSLINDGLNVTSDEKAEPLLSSGLTWEAGEIVGSEQLNNSLGQLFDDSPDLFEDQKKLGCVGKQTVLTKSQDKVDIEIRIASAVSAKYFSITPRVITAELEPVHDYALLASGYRPDKELTGELKEMPATTNESELLPLAEKEPSPGATTPASSYYKNCDAVRAAGKAPLYRGQPGYANRLDGDANGIACE